MVSRISPCSTIARKEAMTTERKSSHRPLKKLYAKHVNNSKKLTNSKKSPITVIVT